MDIKIEVANIIHCLGSIPSNAIFIPSPHKKKGLAIAKPSLNILTINISPPFSGVWRNSVREFGAFPFGSLADINTKERPRNREAFV